MPCYKFAVRAMVLAAGLGMRLRPLTDRLPKPLVPVLNRPLVERPLALLRAAGIRDVILNVHHLPDALPDALGDGASVGLRLAWSREEVLLGTGGGVRRAEAFLRAGDEPFIVLNGDSIVEMDLGVVVAAHRATGALATLVLHPQGWERYVPLEHDGAGRLLTVPSLAGEREGAHPDHAAARAAGSARRALFTGVQVVEPAVLEALPAEGCILRQGYAPLLARGAHLGAFILPDEAFFSDLGTPESYLACSRALLARGGGGPLVDPSARVEGAVLDAHTVVGAGARVARGVSLQDCVVWPGTEVTEDASRTILAPGIALRAT